MGNPMVYVISVSRININIHGSVFTRSLPTEDRLGVRR